MKGTTKYAILIFERENKLTTTPDDIGHNLELDAFNLRKIINISIHVLEKQMKLFKNTLYEKYQADIIKCRKGMVEKNMKNIDIWKNINDLIHA